MQNFSSLNLTCESDLDCPVRRGIYSYKCHERVCINNYSENFQCLNKTECPLEEYCSSGECMANSNPNYICNSDENRCPDDKYCINGRCLTNTDPNYICNNDIGNTCRDGMFCSEGSCMFNWDQRYKCNIENGNTCPVNSRHCVEGTCMTNTDPNFRCDGALNNCPVIGGLTATCTDSICHQVGRKMVDAMPGLIGDMSPGKSFMNQLRSIQDV